MSHFNSDLTYTALVKEINVPSVRKLLQQANHLKGSLYVGYLFYGSDNSPAYDWTADDEERCIDPVVKEAYEKAVQNREPGSQSVLLDAIEQILPLLDENNGQLTPEIRNIIESLYERFTEE